MNRFSEKRVVVTGGSRGIGLAAAAKFASEGAQVIVTGRCEQRLATGLAQLGNSPAITAMRCDVDSVADITALFDEIQRRYRSFDILVVNAGVAQCTPFEGVTEDEFDAIVRTNVKGAFFTVQKAAPYLNSGGAVILVGSNLSYSGWEMSTVYAASKAAVLSLTRSLADALRSRRIRVNGVTPGPIKTAMLNEIVLSHCDEAEFIEQELPIGFLGAPDHVANVIAFLASDEASYLLGEDILCDGGSTHL